MNVAQASAWSSRPRPMTRSLDSRRSKPSCVSQQNPTASPRGRTTSRHHLVTDSWWGWSATRVASQTSTSARISRTRQLLLVEQTLGAGASQRSGRLYAPKQLFRNVDSGPHVLILASLMFLCVRLDLTAVPASDAQTKRPAPGNSTRPVSSKFSMIDARERVPRQGDRGGLDRSGGASHRPPLHAGDLVSR